MKNGISPPMPSKKPEREFYVGEKVRVNLHAGKIVDATIRAIIPQTDGLRLQVDFGFEQTALIHVWQVVDD
jgi:transcription antitermination factor NusG